MMISPSLIPSRCLSLLLGIASCMSLPSCANKPAQPLVPVVQDIGWPRTFSISDVNYTVYQPQAKSWDQVQLVAKAVVSAKAPGDQEPAYGLVTFSALTVTDKVTRMVSLENLSVLDLEFPSKETQVPVYRSAIDQWLVSVAKTISLDRLEADMAVAKAQNTVLAQPVKNTPPKFLFSQKPALLVMVQGNPVFKPVPGTRLDRLMNTHALILRSNPSTLYLHLWDGFLTASSLEGPWKVADVVPSEVTQAQNRLGSSRQVDLMPGQAHPETHKLPSLTSTPIPALYVTTQPASLVVFDGSPRWADIPGTQLRYATNTVANVFQSMDNKGYFVLTAGRWFTAASWEGPWNHVPNDGLPADFAQIPDNSPKENVLASVAGTHQAQEAVIANSIPQMTQVKVATVDLNPAMIIDGGTPTIVPVEGTSLSYVMNCSLPLIQVSPGNWYVLQNGIWFTGSAVTGPWKVATRIPAAIYTIPLSSPLHWVTYVKIYRESAGYVWTGYTPGYYGSMVNSSGVVVYGTGYDYTPYVGTVYVATPVTFGYDPYLAWTPWGGWGFGFAAGFAWGASWGYWCAPPPVPYWGAYAGWAYNSKGGVTAWGPGGWASTTGNVYHNWGNWNGVTHSEAGFNAWTGRESVQQWGQAYNSKTGAMAVGTRGAVANAYNGNYAAGERGTVVDPKNGIAASGVRGTVGNVNTGWSANYAHGTVVNSTTGQSAHVTGIQDAAGNGIYHSGNTTFATDNGNIYRHSDGSWQEYNKSANSWNSVNDGSTRQSLSDTWARQSAGSFRSDSWGATRSSFGQGGGWGQRSWGGGGLGGFRGGFRR